MLSAQGGFDVEPRHGASGSSFLQDGTELSSMDMAHESCNLDDSLCMISKDYGYTFNKTAGANTSFQSALQYIKGRNKMVIYSQDRGTISCEI
jgi:hypothetical protein